MGRAALVGSLALAVVIAGSMSARAQEPAVPNRAAAAAAYDRGSAFYLNGDFGRAAQWFETAYRLAPSAPALIQAMRAQLRAGHVIRAANLALRLEGLHGDVPEALALAREVLAEHAGRFFRIDVDCEGCTLEVDGRVWSYTAAFVEPATEHRIVVQRGDARRETVVRGARGERQALEAPPPPAGEAEPDPPPEPPQPEPEPITPPERMPLSPWFFGVGLAATAISGGVLIWSGVDTLAGVDAYNANPTREAFEEGEAKELRTNVLIGVTAGLAATTLLFAILTDWGGAPSVAIGVDASSARVWVAGSF